jgi:hypothetical protein
LSAYWGTNQAAFEPAINATNCAAFRATFVCADFSTVVQPYDATYRSADRSAIE